MRIALVAPPFIPVPPRNYGGTELFLHHLALGLLQLGHEVVVYANGESRLPCEVRSRFGESCWPLGDPGAGTLRSMEHVAWSMENIASDRFDIIHLNDAIGIPFTRFVSTPTVYTLHHPHADDLSSLYDSYPDVRYVAISRFQARQERMPRCTVIHHGIDLGAYRLVSRKDDYAAFIGRIAPCKGAHLAIEVARRSGVPLKIAGEIQPVFRDYWETAVQPYLDGSLIQYVGTADHAMKNDLLGRARALLFPIQWDEPFGLVMIEAMACGTPVLALPGGSVPEVVCPGVSGWICRSAADMARRLVDLDLNARACREYVARHFTLDLMVRRYEDQYRRSSGALGELLALAGAPQG